MNRENILAPTSERGLRVALIFALAAERLKLYYEHGQWITEAQGASLAAEWLSRSKRSLPLAERRLLSDLSDQLARQIAASLSREAGAIHHPRNDPRPWTRITTLSWPSP